MRGNQSNAKDGCEGREEKERGVEEAASGGREQGKNGGWDGVEGT